MIYSQLWNDRAKAQFPGPLQAEVHTWQATELVVAMESHSHSQAGRQAGRPAHTAQPLSRIIAPRKRLMPHSHPQPPRGTVPEQSLANVFTLGAKKECPRRKFLPSKSFICFRHKDYLLKLPTVICSGIML